MRLQDLIGLQTIKIQNHKWLPTQYYARWLLAVDNLDWDVAPSSPRCNHKS
jgi:hypothetical protein